LVFYSSTKEEVFVKRAKEERLLLKIFKK